MTDDSAIGRLRDTAQEFGTRWRRRFSFNQLVTNASLLALWPILLGVTIGVGRGALTGSTAQLYGQLVIVFAALHAMMAMHLDKAFIVFLTMARERSAAIPGGEEVEHGTRS